MSRGRKIALWVIVALLLLPPAAHFILLWATDMDPPELAVAPNVVTTAADDPTRRELGASWARRRGRIHEVLLSGAPADIGDATVKLLYDEQVAIERDMHEQFAHYVPWSVARLLLVDMARLRFRGLDDAISPEQRLEIAAQARAFDPDPFSAMMDTYQRFVFLHSLYDIMLSFERSPLIGCTSFMLGAAQTKERHTLVGRNFDFEGPAILDERKAVYLMREDGHIPYASVSWPGFVGVTTGMNAEGVAVVIHGARAGEPNPRGEPVVQTVRALLRRATTTREAIAMLETSDPMVPHMLLIADARDDSVVVERIPGHPPHLRDPHDGALPLTNHLEGPLAGDAKNHEVRAHSSTLPRRARLDELLGTVHDATAEDVIAILRDKRAAGGAALSLGHRHAIDALIATHSVVLDTTARALWVNEGPHASGRYIRFDLTELLAPDYRPTGPADVQFIPVDPMLDDGSYEAWRAAGGHHDGIE